MVNSDFRFGVWYFQLQQSPTALRTEKKSYKKLLFIFIKNYTQLKKTKNKTLTLDHFHHICLHLAVAPDCVRLLGLVILDSLTF